MTSQVLSAKTKANLADPGFRSLWRKNLDFYRCKILESNAKAVLINCRRESSSSSPDVRPHPILSEMSAAIRACQTDAYRDSWNRREALRKFAQQYELRREWLSKLEGVCPGVSQLLEQWQGESSFASRIGSLAKAFQWSAAKNWLISRTKTGEVARLSELACVQTDHLQDVVEKLTSHRAWAVFLKRIDRSPRVLKDLIAWRKAQQRIGKGTGAYAFRHRREASDYLMRCVSEMPAWIMPLHKVWENANATAGLFDTVIIDEASQAGIDSTLLLLLAKRIIVVGDDMQNSPEGVGVREDDLANLVRKYLHDFPYGRTFRHDSSLFDHAEREFSNLVSLREHFRCVPEIIRFSNDQFYTDAPLIPLRQRPPQSLAPLQRRFVPHGVAEGEDARILNRTEAEEIVKCIEECLKDRRYEGKTMGVIALQGHAQSREIDRMLRDRIHPRIIDEAKLRCGDSATFQGDQRDVMFLSLVVAPNKKYAARTTLADQRRYNVAMSRARDQVWLFHSVATHDLSQECLRRKLLSYFDGSTETSVDRYFRNLEWLEAQARMPRKLGEQPTPFDSWFEVDVALELLRRRYRVIPQWEVTGRPRYRIDLVIEGSEGRLAVECDGDHHLEPQQIEKDLERQRQLERAEWEFVRIPASEFYADRVSAIHRIEMRCQQLGITPNPIYADSACEPDQIPDISLDETRHNEEFVSTNGEAEGVSPDEPYFGYDDGCAFPDPREASTSNVRQALLQIVDRDSPLSFASIVRLYREGCPAVGRAAKTVQAELRKALGVMIRIKQIESEVEFPDGSDEGRIFRRTDTPKVKERPRGRRKLEEIPLSEILTVLTRIGADLRDLDLCSRLVLDHYCYDRLTSPRRSYIQKVLRYADDRPVQLSFVTTNEQSLSDGK